VTVTEVKADEAATRIQKIFRQHSAKNVLQKKKEEKAKSAREYWQELDRAASKPGASPVAESGAAGRRAALVIVDVQYDFLPPTGSMAVRLGTDIIPIINQLRGRVKFHHTAISQDWHPLGHSSFCSTHKEQGASLYTPFLLPSGTRQMMWPDHCIQNSKGAEIHKDLVRKDTDSIVRKGENLHIDSYSAFYDNDYKTATELSSILKKHQITDVYICGLAYDYCVGYTALDAVSEGFRTFVLEDATKPIELSTLEEMKKRLQAAGVGIIQSTDIPKDGIYVTEKAIVREF